MFGHYVTISVVNKDLTLKAKAKDLTLKDEFNRILTPQFNLSVESDNQQKMHKNTLTNDAMAKHRLTVTDRPIAVQ